MERYFRISACLVIAAMHWLLPNVAHAANCTSSNITLFSVAPVSFGNYSPYSGSPALATFSVTIGTNGNCTNLYFGFTAVGGSFDLPPTGLSYLIAGNPPTVNSPLKKKVSNEIVTLTYTASIAPGQFVRAGAASDTDIQAKLFLKVQGNLVEDRSRPVNATVFVQSACQLPPPDQSSVDFTAALTSGIPNPAIVRTVTFSNASCLLPARIRLSGAALQANTALPPRPAFDRHINWHAGAVFGLASADLNTSGTAQSQAVSSSKNAGGSGSTLGNVTININLLAGTRPQAGGYSGTLTVTIDPQL